MMIFEHSKDFFTEDNESLRSIDMGKRMEVAEGIKDPISNKAMDVRMPGEEIAESLNRGDEAGLKRFMRENGAKEFIVVSAAHCARRASNVLSREKSLRNKERGDRSKTCPPFLPTDGEGHYGVHYL